MASSSPPCMAPPTLTTLAASLNRCLQGSDELWLRRWAAAFNVTTSGVPHLEMHGFRCNDDWLQRVREAAMGKQVVGVSSFEGIVGAHVRHPGLEWRYEDVDGRQTACQRSYVQVRCIGHNQRHCMIPGVYIFGCRPTHHCPTCR